MTVLDRFLTLVQSEDYLGDARLLHLRDYKYQSVDLSPTTKYVMRHWWNWVASLMPPWLAPNAITLIGLGFVLANVVTVFVAIPDLEGPAPSWMYGSFAVALFIYQTLDNVDGKQARKTGTSSPLGELFDHGIDSLNCLLAGLVQCATLALGHSPYAICVLLMACWPMYLSTWEEYHTGVLYLGYINGPTEGILIACALHLVTAIHGPGFWSQSAPHVLPQWLKWAVAENAQIADLVVLGVFLALVAAHAPACFGNVKRAIAARPPLKAGESPRAATMLDAVTELSPMFAFTGLALTWTLSPYSCLLDREYVIEITLLLCCIFGRMSTRMILAHLTKGPFPWFSLTLLPLLFGAALVNLPFFGLPPLFKPGFEVAYLHLSLFLSFLSYSHASLTVIDRFCRFLGIQCLKIPYAGNGRAVVNVANLGGPTRRQ